MRKLLLLLSLLSISPGAYSQKKGAEKPYDSKPKPEAAEEAIRSAYKDGNYAKAVELADEALVAKPGDQKLLVIKALSYGMLGRTDMVRRTADVLYPHSLDTEGIFLATLPLSLSHAILQRDGDWYIAEGHKLAPKSPLVYMIEASIYADDSMWEKGKAAALTGVALLSDKEPASLKAQFANVMHVTGAKDEAYRLIDQQINANPSDSPSLSIRYAMLLRDKKQPEALSALNTLIAQHPNSKRLHKERAFLYDELNRHGDACSEALMLANEDDTYFGLLRKLGCPQAFANLSPTNLKSYTYDVDYNGMQYQFIVSPKNIRMDAGAQFDWRMTNSDAYHGSVAISKSALDTAHNLMNRFSGGPSNLNNMTTVWVSNAVYRELKRDGSSLITAGGNGPKRFAVVDDDGEATVTNAAGRTKALKTLHIRSEDNQEDLWINDDVSNPLITRMSIGWSIVLTSIE